MFVSSIIILQVAGSMKMLLGDLRDLKRQRLTITSLSSDMLSTKLICRHRTTCLPGWNWS